MGNDNFPTSYDDIIQRLDAFNPVKYAGSRNYLDGDVSYLSPYISRGVISTKMIMNHLFDKGFDLSQIEKFIQELAWRDYWQQVWNSIGEEINKDFKRPQFDVKNWGMPQSMIDARTGINAIDKGIEELYETGYMHNHLRMYTASIACNIAGSRWKTPAQWMYYHLLDGDWASNALSWQWVAGTFSNKRYFANQDNINKYSREIQKSTFLDKEYHELEEMEVPEVLGDTGTPELKTSLPSTSAHFNLDSDLPTLIYNYYNLDPNWKSDIRANRILLLEPETFKKYPVGEHSIKFMLELAKNIEGIQLFNGSFNELREHIKNSSIYYKEHPLNHYDGTEESRDWMFDVQGYYPSFFTYWKKCLKSIKKREVEV